MSVPTKGITEERLKSWKKKLAEANATPIILIGVGHDHKSGELVLCVPEGVSDDLLFGALVAALDLLKPGLIPKHDGESRRFP